MAATKRKTPIKYRRGRPLPSLRHGDVIDLTTFPLRSRPLDRQPIERCPACGRKGERTTYRGVSASYKHSVRYESLFWMVLDVCDVRAEVAG
jgi:hypothetical protein